MRKRTRCGWVCLLACLVYVLQVTWIPVYGAEPKAGERTRAGGDAGEAVPMDTGSGSGGWGWLLGAGAALLAGVAGFLLADDASGSDDKDDADAAADAAAAAAAQAAANASATNGATADDGAKVFITGTFTSSAATTWRGGAPFIPSMTFTTDYESYPGGISGCTASGVGGGGPGKYEKGENKCVLIMVSDEFYVGSALMIDEVTLKLQNGVILKAQGGAKIYLLK